jgi:hypothetical protein
MICALSMSEDRDTIPRLQQILPHMREQLAALRQGGTFEGARKLYSATVEKLALQGIGRRTASRVGDQDAYWSSTADMLMEAMRLGFVERGQVPSARRYVEVHRDRGYALTLLGRQMAELAENDVAAFCDRLTAAIYEAHPYFRALIEKLQAAPIACPEVSESEVDAAGREGRGTKYWAEYVTEKLRRQDSVGQHVDTTAIRQTIVSILRQRFGVGPEAKPTSKELTKTINGAFAVAAFTAHGLPIGATDIDMLKSWGSQLRVLDQSRYVPGFDGFNLIWLAADLVEGSSAAIRRRELRQHENKIATAVVDAYWRRAATANTNLSAPYVPIFQVRADAAFHCRVTRALVDLVIERLSNDAIADLPSRVLLHLGTTRQPASEPVYRRGGNRRYEMTIHPTQTKGA